MRKTEPAATSSEISPGLHISDMKTAIKTVINLYFAISYMAEAII